MSINLDSRVCTGCGIMEVTRRNCPDCPCNYCKSEGHSAQDCPRLKCSKCGKKGVKRHSCPNCPCLTCSSPQHVAPQCPHSKDRQATGPLGWAPPQPTKSRERGLKRKHSSGNNESEQPLSTDLIEFPNMDDLFSRMMKSFLSSKNDKVREYGKFLESKSQFRSLFLECIEPEIRDLEGGKVDAKSLLEIKAKQISRANESSTRVFKGAGGYLDFLTDDRNENYLKFYVGQSKDLSQRVHEHCLRLTRGDVSSLHYYIHALGGVKRSFNFIRLFRSPKDVCSDYMPDDNEFETLITIFEMAFALAFESLPDKVHDMYLGDRGSQRRQKTMHLNVLSPLQQGSRLRGGEVIEAREQLNSSTDPEIRGWVAFRQEVHRLSPKTNRDSVSFRELRASALALIQKYIGMTSDTIDFTANLISPENQTLNMQEVCQETFSKAREEYGIDADFEMPVGKLSASIAVVYGFSKTFSRSGEDDVSQKALRQFELDKVGLTPDNSLVWSSSFGLSKTSEISDSVHFESLCCDFDELTTKMLGSSSAKVVIVCGRLSQQVIQDNAKRLDISGPHQMIFSKQGMSVAFEADDDELRRVYIYAPELFDMLHGHEWVRKRKMTICLKLAALLLNAEELKYRFYEIADARDGVFDVIMRNREGENVTPESIKETAKDWLHRRGFGSSEDLTELAETSGGSLGQSIHVLYCVLWHYHHPKRQAKRAPPGLKDAHTSTPQTPQTAVFGREKMDAVRQLWLRKMHEKHPEVMLPSSILATSQEEKEKEEFRQETTYDELLGTDREPAIELADQETARETEKNLLSVGSWSNYNWLSREDSVIDFDESVPDTDPAVEQTLLPTRRLTTLERRRYTYDSLKARVIAIVKAGASTFEQVCDELPDCPKVRLGQVYYSEDVLGDKLPKKVDPRIQGDERVFLMFGDGLPLHNQILHLLGRRLNLNFRPKAKYLPFGLETGCKFRIWIYFLNNKEHKEEPWCKDSEDNALRTFQFRASREGNGFEDSIALSPVFEKPRDPKVVRDDSKQIEILAAEIVDLRRDWERSNGVGNQRSLGGASTVKDGTQ